MPFVKNYIMPSLVIVVNLFFSLKFNRKLLRYLSNNNSHGARDTTPEIPVYFVKAKYFIIHSLIKTKPEKKFKLEVLV